MLRIAHLNVHTIIQERHIILGILNEVLLHLGAIQAVVHVMVAIEVVGAAFVINSLSSDHLARFLV